MLADLLRCDLLPECYTMPAELRDLRRVLRYRNFLVRHATSLQNRISGLLMESGESYNNRRLHGERYFQQLLEHIEAPASVLEMLRLSRGALTVFSSMEKRLRRGLLQHPTLRERVERLRGNGSSHSRRLVSVRGLVNQGISRYPLDFSYHE